MPRTRLDVVALAHRRLGVLAADEPLTADQAAYGRDALDALLAELRADVPAARAPRYVWTADSIPDGYALPLAHLLAVEIAPHYEVQPRDTRARCVARLRALAYPNDLPPRSPTGGYLVPPEDADEWRGGDPTAWF